MIPAMKKTTAQIIPVFTAMKLALMVSVIVCFFLRGLRCSLVSGVMILIFLHNRFFS